jgi:hypothetical protein
MHTIAEIVASDTRRSWQECVALVQEIASQLAPGQPVPAADDLLLSDDGVLSFGFAGESSQPQVADLGALLSALLEGTTAPQALLDFARENGRPEPAHPTLDGFRKALAFYERPNRASDLAAVAGRLAMRADASRAREVVAQLREKVLTQPDVPEPKAEKQEPLARRPRPRPRRMSIAAAGVALVAILSVAMFRSRPAPASATAAAHTAASPTAAGPAPGPSATDDSRTRTPAAASTSGNTAAAAVKEGRNAAPHAPTAATPTALITTHSASADGQAPRRDAPPPRTRAVLPASRSIASSTPSRARVAVPSKAFAPPRPLAAEPTHTAPTAAVSAVQPLELPMPAPVASTRGGQSAALASDVYGITGYLSEGAPVYSRADPQVRPPRILRQQLPSVPLPNALTGYLEFIVDTQGDVESLSLISPTTRFHDLMLVAAAKAWKFKPAQLAGHPVKYRMRVAITLDGSS